MNRLKKSTLKKLHIDTVILSVSFLFLLFFAVTEIQIYLHVRQNYAAVLYRMLLLIVICALFYLGGILYTMRTRKRGFLRRLMLLFFLLYLYLLLNITLLDPSLGRGIHSIYGENKREYYLQWYVNFHPFRSIYEVYIQGFAKGYVDVFDMLLNLLGNVCAFMPFSFFLPLLFKKQKKGIWFLLTMLLTVSLIEAMQFFFMIGSCDVDDLILNVSGALMLYYIFKIPPIQKCLATISGTKKKDG